MCTWLFEVCLSLCGPSFQVNYFSYTYTVLFSGCTNFLLADFTRYWLACNDVCCYGDITHHGRILLWRRLKHTEEILGLPGDNLDDT